MKRILLTAFALALAAPALAAQQDIAQISAVTASREALRTAVNTQLSAVQANFDEVYAVIAAGPVYVNASAPADTKVVWIDTDQDNAIKVYVGGVWTVVGTAGSGDDLGSAAYADVVALWTTCTGYLKSDGTCDTPSGSATYPSAAGVANWDGSAWGTSYTVGTAANNLVQLNASAQLPAVSGALLTNIPMPSWLPSAAPTADNQIIQATGGCSNTTYTDQATCEANSGAWTPLVGAWTSSFAGLINDAGTGTDDLKSASWIISELSGKQATLSAASTITSLFSGSGDYLKSDGTKGTPTGGAGITDGSAVPYSDTACTSGSATYYSGNLYICTGGFYTQKITTSSHSNPTPAPTLSSRTIGTDGTTLTLVGSESLSLGADADGSGFDVDCSTAGNDITATYASGAPGTSLVYTLGSTVTTGDTCDLDYTASGNTIMSAATSIALGVITSGAITNNSTQTSSVLKDSQTASNDAGFVTGQSTSNPWGASSFIAGSSYTLTSLDVYIRKFNTPSGTYVCKLYTNSAGTPGTLIATSTTTIAAGDVLSSYSFINYAFSGVSITSGNTYWIVLNSAGITPDNINYWGGGTTTNSGFTQKVSTDGVSWSNQSFNKQLLFKTYGY